jgi:hypothetical protein
VVPSAFGVRHPNSLTSTRELDLMVRNSLVYYSCNSWSCSTTTKNNYNNTFNYILCSIQLTQPQLLSTSISLHLSLYLFVSPPLLYGNALYMRPSSPSGCMQPLQPSHPATVTNGDPTTPFGRVLTSSTDVDCTTQGLHCIASLKCNSASSTANNQLWRFAIHITIKVIIRTVHKPRNIYLLASSPNVTFTSAMNVAIVMRGYCSGVLSL